MEDFATVLTCAQDGKIDDDTLCIQGKMYTCARKINPADPDNSGYIKNEGETVDSYKCVVGTTSEYGNDVSVGKFCKPQDTNVDEFCCKWWLGSNVWNKPIWHETWTSLSYCEGDGICSTDEPADSSDCQSP
jgi:hypothetical protein